MLLSLPSQTHTQRAFCRRIANISPPVWRPAQLLGGLNPKWRFDSVVTGNGVSITLYGDPSWLMCDLVSKTGRKLADDPALLQLEGETPWGLLQRRLKVYISAITGSQVHEIRNIPMV